MNFYDAMNEVLETPRYDFLTGRRVSVRDTIFELVDRFFSWLFRNVSFNFSGGGGGVFGLVVTVILLVVIVLAIIAAVFLVRSRISSRQVKRHSLSDIFEEIKNFSVDELIELSDKAEDMRFFVRYRYIAAILSLNEKALVKISPSATNAVILRQIKENAPPIFEQFYLIAETFHYSWFGYKEIGDGAKKAFDSAVGKVVNHAKD
jgi:hypothetical protein